MVGTDTVDVCDLSTEMFDRFAQFIGSELGIKMPDSKRTMIQSRLLRRVRELHLQSVEEYGQYFFASANSEERHHFINAVTTHKTDFFREPQHFDYLARVALPTLHRHAEGPNYRLGAWSGACSSGEEPYTLAMVLDQYARQQPGFDFAILATDVSLTIVEKARTGIYSEAQVSPVPPDLQKKYLLRSKNQSQRLVRVAPDLRKRVSFHTLNLMDERLPGEGHVRCHLLAKRAHLLRPEHAGSGDQQDLPKPRSWRLPVRRPLGIAGGPGGACQAGADVDLSQAVLKKGK